MDEQITSRRAFVIKCAALLFGSVLVPSSARRVAAADNGSMNVSGMSMSESVGKAGVEGFIMSADLKNHCGACEYWGGPHRISADGKTLTITGLGWCNNPDSPNYRKQTTPDHGPMDTWRKWRGLS